jgi:hypothetical protein
MKHIHNMVFVSRKSAACARAVEILHAEGIESAEFWINTEKLNKIYDHIEEEYLRMKKIIYIN